MTRLHVYLALLVALAAGRAEAAVSTTDLIGYYRFNDGSGTTVRDTAGKSDGTVRGTASFRIGYKTAGLYFDGTTSTVKVPDASNHLDGIATQNAFTAAAWVYRQANQAGWQQIIGRQVGTGAYEHFAIAFSDNVPRVVVASNQVGTYECNSGASASTGAWIQYAATWDGSTGRLYVNGTQACSFSRAVTLSADTTPLYIAGESNDGTDTPISLFNGKVDEVLLYKRAISAAEALELARGGQPAMTKYWIGGSGTINYFDDDTKWSTSSGGSANTTTPRGYDTAVFDGNGTGSAILAFDPQIQGVQMGSGYSGTFSAPQSKTVVAQGLMGDYYSGMAFNTWKGSFVDSTIDWSSNFDGGTVSPRIGVSDTFSVVWQGQVKSDYTGSVTFYTYTDDGVRLWVNGTKVIDNWTDHGSTWNSGSVTLTSGQWYDIRLEYYDNIGGAVMQLQYAWTGQSQIAVPASKLRPPPYGLTGAYYTYTSSSPPSGCFYENGYQGAYLDTDFSMSSGFDTWVSSNRIPGTSDKFCVRWTGLFKADYSETYTFYASTDDGARMWVNNIAVIDDWTGHGLTEASGSIALEAGKWYEIWVEYFEATIGAGAKLEVSSASQTRVTLPVSRLRPFPLTLGGNGFTQAGGTFYAPGSRTIAAGPFEVSGGTFTANSGAVVLASGTSGNLRGTSFHDLVVGDGLIGYWKFDDTGTIAVDSSGYGNDGWRSHTSFTAGSTATLPTTSTTVPTVNFTNPYSLAFTGGNYVVIPDRDDYRKTAADDYTVSAWIRTPSSFTSSWNGIVAKARASNVWYGLWLNPSNKFACAGSGSGATGNIDGTSTLAANTWYHVACVQNATAGTRTLYVNGASEGSASPADGSGVGDWNIGRSDIAENWAGQVDEVRLYSRALGVPEVRDLARGAPGGLRAVTYTLTGALDVNGDLALHGAQLDAGASSYGINVAGSWLAGGGWFNARSGTVVLDGTSSGKTLLSGRAPFYNLTVSGSGGWTLGDRLYVTGTMAISAGTVDVSTSSHVVHAAGINQTGGTFTAQSGTVVVDPTAGATLKVSSALNNLRIESPRESGLVGHFKLDEGRGLTTKDASPNGNNGTVYNNAYWSTTTFSSSGFDNAGSLTFDGGDDYVAFGTTGLPANNAAQTVSFWMYSTDNSGSHRNAVSLDGGGTGLTLGIRYGEIAAWANGSRLLVGSAVPAANAWHHIVYTWDGTTNRLYVDGAAAATSTTAPDTGTPPYGRLGTWSGGGDYYAGRLDDVRFYNRTLSANEVTALYNARYASGAGASETSLSGHWKLDETSGGTSATDSSGNGHTGTLANGPVFQRVTAGGATNLRSLQFDSARLQHVSVTSTSALSPTTAITISAWVNATSWGGGNNRRILQKGNSDNQYRFNVESNQLLFNLTGVGSATTSVPSAGVWHHLAGTWDGTTIKVWVDGTASSSAATGTIATTSDPLDIGAKYGSAVAGDYFNGYMDDVRIYSRALSTAEITALAQGRRAADVALGANLTVGGTLDVDSGALSTAGYTTSVTGAARVNAGALSVGSAAQTLSGGLTVQRFGVLELLDGSGTLSIGSAQTLSVLGTLAANKAALPLITSVGNFVFSVGTTATVNVNGLRVQKTTAAGLDIADGATISDLRGVQFSNNAGGAGSQHLKITASALTLHAPDCTFDSANSVAANVKLVGNGTADGDTRATFEFKDTSTHGALGGEAYDSDDDANGDGASDNPTTNGAVVQWVYSGSADTEGAIEGFPTAAFDWNTFTYYGTYVAFKNVGGTSSADRIYVRNAAGDAQYSYDIPQTAGDVIGAPRWDTVNETSVGGDVNGDGDAADTSVHVVYIATTGGSIYKLIDTGSALALPGAGAWTSAFTSASVTSITSPLSLDSLNLYFGGKDGSSATKIFAVQVTPGAGDKTLVKNIATSGTGDIATAPSRAVYNNGGNKTYVYIASKKDGTQAYIYRVEVVSGAVIEASCCGASVTAHDLNGSVRVMSNRAITGDSGGRLHAVAADAFGSGLFVNASGFPFRDTNAGRHTMAGLDDGSYAITASPYVEATNSRIYYGDKDGHLYAVTWAGALVSGFPMRPTTNQLSATPLYQGGLIVAGSNAGEVFIVDESAASIYRTYGFGSTGISGIARDAATSKLMVATADGRVYWIDLPTDPT